MTESILNHEASAEENRSRHGPRHVVSSKSVWRVPSEGILEFDSVSSHPSTVLLTPYSFDLSVVEDRNDLRDVWTRACSHHGQSLWNSTLDRRAADSIA